MVVGLMSVAMAATITVDKVLEGETYTAYQILHYTSAGDAYSYYLTAEEYDSSLGAALVGAGFTFTQSADKTQYVLNETTMTADQIVAALKTADLSKAISIPTKKADSDGQAVFTDLQPGYYFVTSTLGSLCAIASFDDEELIVEKNTTITDNKVVDENSANAQVGDVLNYTITLTDPESGVPHRGGRPSSHLRPLLAG